jgi:hypothetical protein
MIELFPQEIVKYKIINFLTTKDINIFSQISKKYYNLTKEKRDTEKKLYFDDLFKKISRNALKIIRFFHEEPICIYRKFSNKKNLFQIIICSKDEISIVDDILYEIQQKSNTFKNNNGWLIYLYDVKITEKSNDIKYRKYFSIDRVINIMLSIKYYLENKYKLSGDKIILGQLIDI